MNVAFVGLAYSHPYIYHRILASKGVTSAYIWDDDSVRRDEFGEQSGAMPIDSLASFTDLEIDGVILTSRLPERIEHAVFFLEHNVPVYFGKPMATNRADVARIVEAVRKTGTPFMTTSVLRFAPAMLALQQHLDRGTVGKIAAIHVTAAHPIDRYMEEPHTWQDDPTLGGGTLLSMGVHAMEILNTIHDEKVVRVTCRTDRRIHTTSQSEDVALLTVEWESGLLGSIEIVGGVNAEYYGLEVFGSTNIIRASIPKADVVDFRGAALGNADSWVEFGYAGTMEAFVRMCQTREMPIPLETSASIAQTLLAARISSSTGRVEPVGAYHG